MPRYREYSAAQAGIPDSGAVHLVDGPATLDTGYGG
jgi:hypothetical protein